MNCYEERRLQRPPDSRQQSYVSPYMEDRTAAFSWIQSGEQRRRQRRNARRRCLAVRGLVRLSIEQPLALRAGEQGGCPFPIRHVARVCAEIELGEIAVQVRL